jgi:hypothetical protein
LSSARPPRLRPGLAGLAPPCAQRHRESRAGPARREMDTTTALLWTGQPVVRSPATNGRTRRPPVVTGTARRSESATGSSCGDEVKPARVLTGATLGQRPDLQLPASTAQGLTGSLDPERDVSLAVRNGSRCPMERRTLCEITARSWCVLKSWSEEDAHGRVSDPTDTACRALPCTGSNARLLTG